MERESTKALIYDDEFADLLDAEDQDLRRIVGWSDGDDRATRPWTTPPAPSPTASSSPPSETGRYVILTSGTTGTPKGAQRGSPDGLDPAGGLPLEDPAPARARRS